MFTFTGTTAPFLLFSPPHLIALAVLGLAYAGLFLFRRTIIRRDRSWRMAIAAVLLIQEIVLAINRAMLGIWTLQESLPLHLCSIGVIFTAVLMITRSPRLYELMYFWGMVGAVQALLTPDIGPFGFPHFRYYQFFLSHGTIIFGVLYFTFVLEYRPSLRSVFRSFLALNILLPFIALANRLTGGNYFFISGKPETASALDYLGPWPWYILVTEVIALAMFLIFYLPVGLEKRLGRAPAVPPV